MWLFLSIMEWKDGFSKKTMINNWAIEDGVVTLLPHPPSNSKNGAVLNSGDDKQPDAE